MNGRKILLKFFYILLKGIDVHLKNNCLKNEAFRGEIDLMKINYHASLMISIFFSNFFNYIYAKLSQLEGN